MDLSEPLKGELARLGVPSTLEGVIELSIQIDRLLREHQWERSTGQVHPVWMLPKVSSQPI